MPEGHTIHRLAEDYAAAFTGTPTRVTSPQGKFADAAALLDGTPWNPPTPTANTSSSASAPPSGSTSTWASSAR